VAESETALSTLVSVRDRVISAYEEIMRMQV
jgi:flagellar hook-basal body complex protein FliE